MFYVFLEEYVIDGVKYSISSGAKVDSRNCKDKICEIYDYFDPDSVQMNCTPDTYISWKKDLVKKCKEWDKMYLSHIKKNHPEIYKVHLGAMKPLVDLIDSNLNLDKLERMEQGKKDVPQFRKFALEEEFCKHMTGVCQIFKEFGEMKEGFNIK